MKRYCNSYKKYSNQRF